MKMADFKSKLVFNLIGYIVVTLSAVLCLLPFWLMISGSLSSNESIMLKGYSLIPREFSLYAYNFIFRFPDDIIKAYGVTIFVTFTGTVLGLFLVSVAGYVLQRNDFAYRNKISFFLYFTTIFQGGLIPWYILLVNYLHLNNTYKVLIFNSLMNPFLIILMRSFMKSSIPNELTEAAKIDGAGDFRIYYNIIIPLAKPALATVGLFLALGYWNDWFNCSLFIGDRFKFNLQYFMYNMLTQAQFMSTMGSSTSVIQVPGETAKLAMAIIATGPIILLYPAVQKYFVKGLTVGAVKG